MCGSLAASAERRSAHSRVSRWYSIEEPRLARNVPAYLDIFTAIQTQGPCFTFPSPLLLALERALDTPRDYAPMGCLVRRRLRERGVRPMVEESLHASVVTTFAAPAPDFVERCRALGYWIGGESGYLAARELVQIANMGAVTCRHIDDFFDHVPFQEG